MGDSSSDSKSFCVTIRSATTGSRSKGEVLIRCIPRGGNCSRLKTFTPNNHWRRSFFAARKEVSLCRSCTIIRSIFCFCCIDMDSSRHCSSIKTETVRSAYISSYKDSIYIKIDRSDSNIIGSIYSKEYSSSVKPCITRRIANYRRWSSILRTSGI